MAEKPRADLDRRRARLLTVKEFAHLTREHPLSIYRRVREGRQPGVHRIGNAIRLTPPDPEEEEE